MKTPAFPPRGNAKAIDEAFVPLAEKMKAARVTPAAAVAEMINTMRAIRTDPGDRGPRPAVRPELRAAARRRPQAGRHRGG